MTPENRKRVEQIQQMRDAGVKWRIISEEIGISTGRMHSLLIRRRNELTRLAGWHDGLATHLANQLKQANIYSREECQHLFVDQEDDLIIRGQNVWPKEWDKKSTMYTLQPHLTLHSVNALRAWLGAPPLSTTKNDTLLKAKKFLESHGYTVTLPPENTDASH